MDGVVTECAGGAIEEIHWGGKDLDGILPVGGPNMPKLKVLDLYATFSYDTKRLKGEREMRERERESMRERALKLRVLDLYDNMRLKGERERVGSEHRFPELC
jgi:hypothetical protein